LIVSTQILLALHHASVIFFKEATPFSVSLARGAMEEMKLILPLYR